MLTQRIKLQETEKKLLEQDSLIKNYTSKIQELEQKNKDLVENFQMVNKRINRYLLKQVCNIYYIILLIGIL